MEKIWNLLFWRPRIFVTKFLYRQYASFHKNLNLPEKVFGFFISLLVLYEVVGKIPDDKLDTVIEIGSSTIFAIVIWVVVQKIIKNTGGKFKLSPNSFFSPSATNKRFSLSTKCIPENRFFQVGTDENKINAVSKLNRELYARTIWREMKSGEKYDRNKKHVERNERCMWLIKDEQDDVGFTHIFPVNSYTWYRYKQGLIGDNNFDEVLIIPSPQTKKDHAPFGLILFSFAISNKHFKKYKNQAKFKINDFLTQAIAVHLESYLKNEFAQYETVPVLFQNMDKRLRKHFKGYETNGIEYAEDGARIICFEVENPFKESQESDFSSKLKTLMNNKIISDENKTAVKDVLTKEKARFEQAVKEIQDVISGVD